jgi:hypothetical protein
MPQLALVVLAGAGIYAGYRWLSRKMQAQLREAQRMMAEMEERERARTQGGRVKDLGDLDYDPETRVYKPRGKT